jgi:hypothetical protein
LKELVCTLHRVDLRNGWMGGFAKVKNIFLRLGGFAKVDNGFG